MTSNTQLSSRIHDNAIVETFAPITARKLFYDSVRYMMECREQQITGISPCTSLDFEQPIPLDPKDIKHRWKTHKDVSKNPAPILVTAEFHTYDDNDLRFAGEISDQISRLIHLPHNPERRLFCNHTFWSIDRSYHSIQSLRIPTLEWFEEKSSSLFQKLAPIYARGLVSHYEGALMFLRNEKPIGIHTSGLLNFHGSDHTGVDLTIHDWLHLFTTGRIETESYLVCQAMVRSLLQTFSEPQINTPGIARRMTDFFCDTKFDDDDLREEVSDWGKTLYRELPDQAIELSEHFKNELDKVNISPSHMGEYTMHLPLKKASFFSVM